MEGEFWRFDSIISGSKDRIKESSNYRDSNYGSSILYIFSKIQWGFSIYEWRPG